MPFSRLTGINKQAANPTRQHLMVASSLRAVVSPGHCSQARSQENPAEHFETLTTITAMLSVVDHPLFMERPLATEKKFLLVTKLVPCFLSLKTQQ